MTYNKINIVTDPEAFSERTDELLSITSFSEVKHAVAKIKDALYAYPDVPAFCAPQLGINLRLFVVRNSKKESNRFKVFINPIIVSSEGMHLSREKCISLGDSEYIIPRRNTIHVAYQETDGRPNSESFTGAYEEVVQQMIELLDGITLNDYGLNLDMVGGPAAFDKAPKKQQAEVIAMYLDTLKDQYADLEKEIKDDPILQDIEDTIEFRTGILKGDIKLNKEETEEEKK